MNVHEPSVVSLDSEYKIPSDSLVVIIRPDMPTVIDQAKTIIHKSTAAYGISGKTTQLELDKAWLPENSGFGHIRGSRVFAKSEALELAKMPIDTIIKENDVIELSDVYEDLGSGRWVMVSGERIDIADTSNIHGNELAMIASIEQKESYGKTHSFLTYVDKLAYQYKRDTVRINANVVAATHGETRREVLGSGNGATPLQRFTLKQPPLTHIVASNPTGADSTLKVYVNDVRWHETDTLLTLTSTDRKFVTKTDDDYNTTLTFGNGWQGARLPTGTENIRAVYRNGIGRAGNVAVGKISQLVHRELGVKEVINPLPATGGADRDSIEQIRRNAPLAIKALDRLVSVQDYEDFTRIFAGLGKARAVEVSNGRQQLVHITIAGADDARIDANSDVYRNLLDALRQAGDPWQAVKVDIRELMLMVLQAGIHILADYQWEVVEKQVRAALLHSFSFERSELGQDVLLSEVVSIIQSVRGVDYVDVDIFGGIPEKQLQNNQREWLTPSGITMIVQQMVQGFPPERIPVHVPDSNAMFPAQLAFISPQVPDTLILNLIP